MADLQGSAVDRGATIDLGQFVSGYWWCEVAIRIPGVTEPFRFDGQSFHNADECLTWARQQIELVTLSV